MGSENRAALEAEMAWAKNKASGMLFEAYATLSMLCVVFVFALVMVFVPACSGVAMEGTPKNEGTKAAAKAPAIADVAGEESIREKLKEAAGNGASREELTLLRTQLEEARQMNREEAEKDLAASTKLKAKQQKQLANEDFYASVKSWTGWATAALVLASVVLLVASFFIQTLPRRGAFLGLLASGGISMLRLALLKYGVLATDLMVYALFGIVALGVVFVVVPIVVMTVRSRIQKVGLGMLDEAKAEAAMQGPNDTEALNRKTRAKQRVREATALLAISSDKINEKRKSVVTALQRTLDGEASMLNEHTLKNVGLKV